MFERIRGELPKVERILVFDGEVPDGMIDVDARVATASDGEPKVPEERRTRRHHDLHERHDRQTEGKSAPPWQRRLAAQAGAMIGFIGYTPDDVYIPTGPLYHSGPGGFMGIAQTLGQTVVLQRKFNAEDWLRLVADLPGDVDVLGAHADPHDLQPPRRVKARYVSSMKRMIANAAPLGFALNPDVPRVLPGRLAVRGVRQHRARRQLHPPARGPAAQARLVWAAGADGGGEAVRRRRQRGHRCGARAHGRVVREEPECVRRLLQAARQVPRRQQARLPDRRRHRCDDEGYIYICDRKKDMIISGGMNIYPAEIEAALEHHADVLEVAVFGTPSEEWGESVHAVVVVREGASMTADDVMAFAREHLAHYKVPRSVTFIDELPKTGSGKVLKRELRAPFWAGRDSKV
ncbi:MAG: long-chain fatty acid--CoA ligase [Ilumatobacteraceae bacterium]